MKRSTLFIAIGTVAVLGFATFASQAARQPLLTPLRIASAGLGADASYLALTSDKATVSVDLVQADASQIDETSDTLQIAVGNMPLVARQLSTTRNEDGTLVWQGTLSKDPGVLSRLGFGSGKEITEDPNNTVMIVRNGDKLTGTLRINGERYALRPLRSGGHAIARIDDSKMPADHPAEYNFLPNIDMSKLKAAKSAVDVGASAVAKTTIRVMVVATQSAANASGDIAGLVNLAIAESNTGYTNSGVDITLQLAGRYTTTYVESGSFSTDLSRFRGTADGYMDSYHATRNTVTADVMMLLINNSSSCGLASSIGSTAATAFAVAHYSCATGYYSFAHEIGHLQSARHDPANDPTTTPYAYGHGFQKTASGWRTIMAYNCSPSCTRLNYWSNPGITYGGAAMGTTATNDNHRVLNNTKATIAAFR
jgi:peptidyl-Asp metalloendopeptidase